MAEAGVWRPVTEGAFFPLAAACGALLVPLSLYGMHSGAVPPGLATPAGHAHELLFGYALAVVAGFLINRLTIFLLTVLVLLWLLARVGFLFLPDSLLALAANSAFAFAVAAIAAPRFMKAAKKWRNRIIGPLVLAIACAAIGLQLALTVASPMGAWMAIRIAVVLFALLMLFFGGRLIAPAAAGAIERAGGRLEARVQPRIEGAAVLAMMAAALTAPVPWLSTAHGSLLILAGTLALVRLSRWQLWRCSHRIDLLCLGVGYAWLGIGLVLLGAARGFDLGLPASVATHAITVGALGTLTTCIMLRNRLLRLRVELERVWPAFLAMTTLMSTASLTRLLAETVNGLLLAAAAWSLALLLLLVLLLHFRQADQPG
jgi:uncharacterized protein involved in response to NO